MQSPPPPTPVPHLLRTSLSTSPTRSEPTEPHLPCSPESPLLAVFPWFQSKLSGSNTRGLQSCSWPIPVSRRILCALNSAPNFWKFSY